MMMDTGQKGPRNRDTDLKGAVGFCSSEWRNGPEIELNS